MFTGLVRDLGVIESIEEVNGNRTFSVRGQIDPKDLTMGASVCHSGVCLTVIDADFSGDAPLWVVEAVPETLRLTSLGSKVAGDCVNLEPSLRLGEELGGHLVFGHVDGLGKIKSIVEEGDGYRVSVEAPEALRPLIALKGSVAVDGISLTIAGVTETGFELAIIPHTFEVTSLGLARAGDAVNLEADMLARYVSRQMEFR